MNTITVNRHIVTNVWGLPWEDSDEHDIEILSDEITGTSRWSVNHELIVRIRDKFYRTKYSIAATEQQEEQPWQYDENVKFTEVHQVEKMVKVWVPVE